MNNCTLFSAQCPHCDVFHAAYIHGGRIIERPQKVRDAVGRGFSARDSSLTCAACMFDTQGHWLYSFDGCTIITLNSVIVYNSIVDDKPPCDVDNTVARIPASVCVANPHQRSLAHNELYTGYIRSFAQLCSI